MPRPPVLFDFYGTLAHATGWIPAETILAERGYTLDADTRRALFEEGIDGIEHVEHSQSREHYLAWQRERTLAMLAESDVHPGEYEEILAAIRAGHSRQVMQAYDEVPGVLDELRAAGVPVVVCSNWDWDLREAVEAAGLSERIDVMVSSAWAGARKPHPRIFRRTLEAAGITDGSGLVFVGDTWGPDVEGPLAMGMRPVYLRRVDHWPDATCPHDDPSVRPEVTVIEDLRGVLAVALHPA